jgi:hypothetical protein
MPGSEDPLSEIEERQGQLNLGAVGYRIYLGARQDGASRFDAFLVAAAWYRSMLNVDGQEEE